MYGFAENKQREERCDSWVWRCAQMSDEALHAYVG